MLILDENFRWHLEAFESELFIYSTSNIFIHTHSSIFYHIYIYALGNVLFYIK